MPRPLIYAALVMVILALIPPALIARSRAVPNDRRRIHLIQDMDNQGKFRAQQVNHMFADDRAMRPPVPHTIAMGELDGDAHFTRGVVDGQWATTFPSQTPVTLGLLARGQERFSIYCRMCHGDAGYGDGIVHKRGDLLVRMGVNGTVWTQPKSLHDPGTPESPGPLHQPVGQLFNTITHGIRNMPSYESQIPPTDRWAIVAYVRALQRSQNARPEDVPADQLRSLPTIVIPSPGGEPSSTAPASASASGSNHAAGTPSSVPKTSPTSQENPK
jgi:mono/diheme cytochrome c family protein